MRKKSDCLRVVTFIIWLARGALESVRIERACDDALRELR